MCDTNVNYAEIALSIGSPTLGMFPSSVMMLGGDNIFIAGPCFEPSNVIVCEFHSIFSLQEEQRNTGESQFIVPKGKGRG